jgi:hypothetical protein
MALALSACVVGGLAVAMAWHGAPKVAAEQRSPGQDPTDLAADGQEIGAVGSVVVACQAG